MQLDDDLRRADDHRLVRRLHALALHVAEHVFATGNVEQLVQKADATAHVQPAQDHRIAADDQHGPRPGPAAYARADCVEL